MRGYSPDPMIIGKGGVLGSETNNELQNTVLWDEINIGDIIKEMNVTPERVRLMRLRANTKISKHTDKVDKDIKSGKIIRLHIPIVTNENVIMKTWLQEGLVEFNMGFGGECGYLDVARPHAVENNSDQDEFI